MKKLGILILIVSILIMAISCVSKDEIIGTWNSEYTYNGNSFNYTFTLENDGTWTGIVYKNGYLSSTKYGTYTIEGNKVSLRENGEVSKTIYTYSSGTLENSGRIFKKITR